jgi:predicted RNA polymerase sigma factor
VRDLESGSEVDVRAAMSARTSYGRLLALLAAADGDLPAAEDALADAFERALTLWPRDGVPDNPDAWILVVARNRQRDRWKSASYRTSVVLEPDRHSGVHLDVLDPDAIGDTRLALMLVCAHPAINPAVHTPLMLNTVLGFTAPQIGRALAIPAATLAARLVRAKRRINQARIPFRVPDATVLVDRMPAVAEAIYGTFAIDGHSSGMQRRDNLQGEALYLAETLAALAPSGHREITAEAHGLAALICLSSARGPARHNLDGALVPLAEQDVTRWDGVLIDRGQEHLRHAHSYGVLGRFQLEAAIEAVHVARRDQGSTEWATLRDLHEALNAVAPTLGSAVALAAVTAEVDGAVAGLALLDEIADRTGHFQPAWSARAHLLRQAGRPSEAREALVKAISLTTDPAQRVYLERQLGELS